MLQGKDGTFKLSQGTMFVAEDSLCSNDSPIMTGLLYSV